MAERKHCAACGERVEAYPADLGGGATELRCPQCELPLHRRPPPAGTAVRFRRVLVADDSPFFLATLEEALASRRLAGEILKAADGAEALELATAALRERRPPALVVLDLLMPRLNGLHAAIALRAVERAFGAHRAEILFLSGRRLDATLRPILEDVAPAHYVNKGADGSDFARRLEEVLTAISGASRGARRG